VPEAPTDGQQYARQSAAWTVVSLPSGGVAPVGAQYITAATDATLTNERVLTNTASVTWDFATAGQARAAVPMGLFQIADADLTALAGLTGTNVIYYRSAADTWTPVTIGTGLTFTSGTLTATVTGGGNVNNTGTPANGQWAQWTDATHIQGVATASMPFVQKAGDTMTGTLTVPTVVVTTSLTAPTITPATDSTTNVATTAFVQSAIVAAGATVAISDTPPGSPGQGKLWWETDTGKLFINYNDGNSTQWVSLFPFTSTGGGGAANVGNVGTPANNQIAVWTDPTHIQGNAALTFDGTSLRAPTVTPGSDSSNQVATTAFVQSALGAAGFSTGDAKLTLKTVADAGWVLMNDGTIGDASSGASSRANADCQALFTLLWNNITDPYATVSSGRGANAAADWAAHKKITLTRQLGRTLAIGGAGAGLTSRPLGGYLGEESHTQSVGEMAAHGHTGGVGGSTANNYVYSYGGTTITYDGYLAIAQAFVTYPMDVTNGLSAYVTINGNGSSTPANVMQPTSFWNIMIKL
jgi:hypothetical protein